jgi:hypothetical protein
MVNKQYRLPLAFAAAHFSSVRTWPHGILATVVLDGVQLVEQLPARMYNYRNNGPNTKRCELLLSWPARYACRDQCRS